MRITKKSSSNTNLAKVLIKINKHQQLSFINKDEMDGNNKNHRQSFLKSNLVLNEEPIKVQLVKNNNNKKIYSTKTVDIKTLYNNQTLLNKNDIYNDDINNFNLNKRQIYSNDVHKQKYKTTTESNVFNFKNINSHDNFNKYMGINSQNKYSSNNNSPRVISTFPLNNNQYEDITKRYKLENTQPRHKIRDLLSKKFLYNKPKTTSAPNKLKKNPHPYDLKTYYNNNYNKTNNNNINNINLNSFISNRKEKIKKDNFSAISMDDVYSLMKNNYNYDNDCRVNIKLDDLIICDEKLNDILIALNNKNKNYEMDASNECAEFFVFYFHSSLQNIFFKFYK